MNPRQEVSVDWSRERVERRRFLKELGAGVSAAVALGPLGVLGAPPPARRRVWAASDLHIGLGDKRADGIDGEEWMARALKDLAANTGPLDYAVVCGDLTQNGKAADLEKYLALRNGSGIPAWYELAGNHEYYHKGIGNYRRLIRSTDPYEMLDGNVAWLFLSDEKHSRQGDLTAGTLDWLRERLAALRDHVVIVCSHQLVHGTVRDSGRSELRLHPRAAIEAVLAEHHVDLWLSGHYHHNRARSVDETTARDGTTFINVASLSHAYFTGASQSFVFEFEAGRKEIVGRCRLHDESRFVEELEVRVPTRVAPRFDHRARGKG
jgi:predicted phosphohydrolase